MTLLDKPPIKIDGKIVDMKIIDGPGADLDPPDDLTPHELGGWDSHREITEGQAYSGLSKNLMAEDAMRLVWPPMEASALQGVTPMPKDRVEWLRGYRLRERAVKGAKRDPATI